MECSNEYVRTGRMSEREGGYLARIDRKIERTNQREERRKIRQERMSNRQKYKNGGTIESKPVWYILDGKTPIPVESVTEWSEWMQTEGNKRVGIKNIGDVEISTVFLGLDHGFGGKDLILFETMVFGGSQVDYQERYKSSDSAVIGHNRICKMVKDSIMKNRYQK